MFCFDFWHIYPFNAIMSGALSTELGVLGEWHRESKMQGFVLFANFFTLMGSSSLQTQMVVRKIYNATRVKTHHIIYTWHYLLWKGHMDDLHSCDDVCTFGKSAPHICSDCVADPYVYPSESRRGTSIKHWPDACNNYNTPLVSHSLSFGRVGTSNVSTELTEGKHTKHSEMLGRCKWRDCRLWWSLLKIIGHPFKAVPRQKFFFERFIKHWNSLP